MKSLESRQQLLSDGTVIEVNRDVTKPMLAARAIRTRIARHDDPGPCPGDGWQLITSHGVRGQRGLTGPRGEKGEKGEKGEPGPTILGWEIDRATYQAVPIMSDGKDGPPLMLRGLFEQFHDERG